MPQLDIDNPVTTHTYEAFGNRPAKTFLYVLGEPVHSDSDKEDIELMATFLRERFARYREALLDRERDAAAQDAAGAAL